MAEIKGKLDLKLQKDLNKQISQINENLRKVIEIEESAARKGLLKVVTFIQGEAQEITPQRTGTLVGSAFRSVGKIGDRLVGRVGYTAKYAPFVHEMPDPVPRTVRTTIKSTFVRGGRRVNWTKKGTGNKFLEKAVKNNVPFILDTLKEFLTPK